MTNAQQANQAKRPVSKLRIGLISAYIWPRPTEKGTFYNVSFERRYKDADGKWQSSFSFNQEDLLALSKLADQAHTEICKLQMPQD